MDARTSSHRTPNHAAAEPGIGVGELRTILSHLSHELSRPLISLRAGFDLLLGDTAQPITEEQRGHVQTMVALCDELLQLTRSYLDYAGLVEGARPLCCGSFTIGALIQEVSRQFAEVAAARRISWSCELLGPDSTVVTDATRWQQILANLVANALKYTPEGGWVRVTGELEGQRWRVIVTDTGPGIPPEALKKVFEPFFRLPRDERSKIEGNGLGLAICREMVKQLAGEIAISSALGQGTRVTVEFPIDASTAGRPRSTRRRGPKPSSA
jgi:signal transduction histidine kinase